MSGHLAEAALSQRYARICGVLYLYIIASGIFGGAFVRSTAIDATDPAATAQNIAASESLFRFAVSAELLHISFDVIVAVLLYALFRPVDRSIALLAAFMRLAADVTLAVASLSHFAALRLYSGAEYLSALSREQLDSLALVVLRLHADGYAICLVFFGFACLALGYLIMRSALLPRIIGALMLVAGACYLINSFCHFLAPGVAAAMFPIVFLPVFVAELSLAVWLTAKGVKTPKDDSRGLLESR